MTKTPANISTAIQYALITGGSHGIGKAMAEECAKKQIPVLLVALLDDDLKSTVQYLRQTYAVNVDYLGIDLTTPDAAKRIQEWCLENNYQVKYLINNVGFGSSGNLNNTPLKVYQAMLRLNNQVMVELTYHFLPHLKNMPGARILNMSSMEATMPLPYKAVYTATKSFIYSFSLALREELREDKLPVTAVCPGPTITNEGGLKRIQAHGNKSNFFVMFPKDVAPAAIEGMLKGKSVVIPGRQNYATVKLSRLLPTTLKMRILERVFRKYK